MTRHHPYRRAVAWRALCLLAVGVLAARAAAEPVRLAWQWRAGDVLTYRVTQTQQQRIQDGGQTLQARHEQVTTFRYTVAEVSTNQVATVAVSYDHVLLTLEDPDGVRRYDSRRPETIEAVNHPLPRLLQGLIGKDFSIRVDRFGKVHEVAGFREILATLSIPDGLANAFDSDALKAQLESTLRVVPLRPVATGESWAHMTHQLLPGIGFAQALSEFTFEEVTTVEGVACARVRFDTDLEVTPSHGVAGPGAEPFRQSGTVFFALEEGRVQRQEFAMHAYQRVSSPAAPGEEEHLFEEDLEQRVLVEFVAPTAP